MPEYDEQDQVMKIKHFRTISVVQIKLNLSPKKKTKKMFGIATSYIHKNCQLGQIVFQLVQMNSKEKLERFSKL